MFEDHQVLVAARKSAEEMHEEYCFFASTVSDCIKEIRQDINRNYSHVHEGHLLDRLAHEFKRSRGPVSLDNSLASEIMDAGGSQYLYNRMMLFSGGLAFAWHLHAEARRKAGEMFVVVKESCGATDQSMWLSKSLALYEHICGGDRDVAIRSLSQVIENWKHTNVLNAIESVNTIKHSDAP